jgi:type II secretory pathway pseudopilin PulG
MARKKKSTEEPQNTPQGDADDTFGLPDLDYKPLDREEPATAEQTSESTSATTENLYETAREEENPEDQSAPVKQTQQYSNTSYSQKQEEPESILPKVLGVILLLAVVAAAVWYFGFYKPQKDKEEQERLAAEKKKMEDARLADEQAERLRLEAEQRRLDSIANATPKEGTFETLTERTGKYYVVVGSAIDDDLINDYARKLSAKGVNSKIIPPFGKVKFYRIAVAEGDSFQVAQETANSMKAEYGDAVWVLKY